MVLWPPIGRPDICAGISIATDGAKLIGALIGTESFRPNFVARRVSKTTTSVAALERLPPSRTTLGYLDAPELLVGATEDGVLDAHHFWCGGERSLDGGSGPLPERQGSRLIQPHFRTTFPACFGRIIWRPKKHPHSMASPTRRIQWRSGCPNTSVKADIIKAACRKNNSVRIDTLIQLLHSRGRLNESCLFRSNRYPRRLRLLISPVS